MKKEIKTAEERGMEMMNIPMKDLPKLAQDFLRHNGKIYLTFYIVYTQLENMRLAKEQGDIDDENNKT